MPLLKGKKKATIKKNFEEFGKGKTYKATEKKYGKEKANRQRIAVVLSTARGKKKKKG
jgi:hypothetical protein